MSSRPTKSTGQRRAAPAAGLLADAKPASKVIDVEAEPAALGAPQVSQVPLEEHQRLQREHREWLAKMAQETPAQAAGVEEAAVEAAEAAAALPSPEELAERAAQEALGNYLAKLIEMPDDEPRYVVGPRRRVLLFDDLELVPGDVVPGAAGWTRLESWLSAGYIVAQSAFVRLAS